MLDKFLHFLRRNDKDRALELLYAWLWREVYYAANYILQDRHLAEEVTQETFLAAHRNLERLRDARKVKAWLIQ
ncbi:MAG: sigma factor, partial [Bacillota bacterium]